MAAGTYNFTLEQGATFHRVITWNDADGDPVPLTGLKARMQVRHKTSDTEILLSLTTENGGITLNDPGEIVLDLDSEVTAGFSTKASVYDLEIVDDSDTPELVTRLLQGAITLSPEVTR